MTGLYPRSAGPAAATSLAVLLALALASLPGCRQAKESSASSGGAPEATAASYAPRAPQLPGCWRLRLTAEGAERDSVRTWLSAGTLPAVLELDTARVSAGGDAPRRAYSWSNGRRGTEPFSVWRPMEDDALRVQREGATAGLMLDLRRADSLLVGSVVQFTDAGMMGRTPPRREAPVEARAVECPAR
jgi:hypothetical protein